MKIGKESISAFVLRKKNSNYEFLLLKRIPKRGGFWQPVTGRCELEESHLKAAKREVKEETGLTDFINIFEDVHEFELEEDLTKKEIVFGFEVKLNTQILLDANIYPEHDEFKWCVFEESLYLLKWSQNKEGLRKLKEKLG
jgi:8-oxo-dGTP pyrophosphatase MutT (NUDIX family)